MSLPACLYARQEIRIPRPAVVARPEISTAPLLKSKTVPLCPTLITLTNSTGRQTRLSHWHQGATNTALSSLPTVPCPAQDLSLPSNTDTTPPHRPSHPSKPLFRGLQLVLTTSQRRVGCPSNPHQGSCQQRIVHKDLLAAASSSGKIRASR